MSSIDPTGQLIAVIRAQFDATRPSSTTARTAAFEKGKAQAKKPNQGIAELVSRRVQTIDPTDPDGSRKAFKIFLEAVLLGELGMVVVNDPAFYRVVDEVQRTMEGDTGLRAKMDEAGRLLLQACNPT